MPLSPYQRLWDTKLRLKPDPLTVLIDAIWIEARWRDLCRCGHSLTEIHALVEYSDAYYEECAICDECLDGRPDVDSISGRNVFWVSVMEGERWSSTSSD